MSQNIRGILENENVKNKREIMFGIYLLLLFALNMSVLLLCFSIAFGYCYQDKHFRLAIFLSLSLPFCSFSLLTSFDCEQR